MMSARRTKLLAAWLIAGIMAAIAVVAGQRGFPAVRTANAEAEATAPSSATAPPSHISAFARIRPRDGVRVLVGPATDFAFRVAHIDVREGEIVVAGQPLAELDVKSERAANLAVSEAQVREAETDAYFASREFSRNEKLYSSSSKAISLQEFDRAHDAAQMALAKLETAKQQQAYAQVMLNNATIRAPVPGMVLHILRHEGEGISADNGLIELGEVAHMEAVAEVFETNARFVKPGQKVVFDSPALSRSVKGTVLRILPKVNRISLYSTNAAENTEARVIQVIVALADDPEIRMLTGLQGTVIISMAGDS